MPRGCPVAPLEDRFLSRRTIDGECWIWNGGLYLNGYGQVLKKTYGTHFAHQWACHHWNNCPLPIEKGMEVSHTCDRRACVNPAHLKYQTKADNMNDMATRNPNAFGKKPPTEEELELLKKCITDGVSRRETARLLKHDRDWVERVIRDCI